MNQALLVEILLEEMPAKPLLQEFMHLKDKWQSVLKEYDLTSQTDFYYTPTRLVLHAPNFPVATPTHTQEHFGPPLNVGMDGHVLNAIGQNFYQKLHLDPTTALQTATKGAKEVLYATTTTPSKPTATLLDTLLLNFLKSLDFGKSMAWGDVRARFIRPIHNICVIFNNQVIDLSACMQTFACSDKQATKLHFAKSFDYFKTPSVARYFRVLKEGLVLLDPKERREKILTEIYLLEQHHQIEVQINPDLLEEIIAITSYPTALYGQFDAKFLKLPAEIITTSMQEHQRYFATFKGGVLNNGFIVVSNTPLTRIQDFTEIIAGNEKVLRARLSDAVFFYHNDLNKPFNFKQCAHALDQIAFIQGLGSLKDKIKREQQIARHLVQKFMLEIEEEQVLEALSLAKIDLLSEVVYEFPELQGIMGSYYAKHHAYPSAICIAIKEQYLPAAENTPLPTTLLGALVSLSYKLDSLLSLFSIGKIPTGSKDPFALRRSCNGVLRICLQYQIPFNLESDLLALQNLGYRPFDVKILRDFMLERFIHVLSQIPNFYPNLYKAVLQGIETLNQGDYEICQIDAKVRALIAFFEKTQTKEFVAVFKRVANITQDYKDTKPVDPDLFIDSSEVELFTAYHKLEATHFTSLQDKIHALFALKEPLEVFFDRVLVNDTNQNIQQNRKGLLWLVYRAFLGVAEAKAL
ncbi:glycine--tRNA ligase subunit beta [Helicobacter suis]|uniref:glycine--tRNA ligase subunit beta n=1 Tax=Helicobacter suis TaxID=104628 RepID=UPI001F083B69|nr:glycine--tRNA ligase subunit beta [Helicobacter suis]